MRTYTFILICLLIWSCGNKTIVNQQNTILNDLKISGKVICEDTISPLEIIAIKGFQNPFFTDYKLLLYEKTDTFNLTIPNETLLNYSHIKFIKGWYDKVVKISDLKEKYTTFTLKKQPEIIVKKPIIYLYPEQITHVKILHEFKGKITTTYPLYQNGWDVMAYPDGKITDLSDNRSHQYLFWEGIYNFPKNHSIFNSGFWVKKENTLSFLQDKLEQIGLNPFEINDFIVYWLPELHQNNFNFIHFRINDNIDNSSFLHVTPRPDTVIRVFMQFYGVNTDSELDDLPEQPLKKIERKGFTLVEWGGAKVQPDKSEILN